MAYIPPAAGTGTRPGLVQARFPTTVQRTGGTPTQGQKYVIVSSQARPASSAAIPTSPQVWINNPFTFIIIMLAISYIC